MAEKGVSYPEPGPRFSTLHLTVLTLLRVAIGWHFLYEGIVKLLDPNWSSAAYLMESRGILSGVFQAIARNPGVLAVVDTLNIWGLLLIGLGLMLGILTRFSAISGILLLGLYYLANPPLISSSGIGTEGSYLFVDKNLVELLALAVIAALPTKGLFGIDHALASAWKAIRHPRAEAVPGKEKSAFTPESIVSLPRRDLVKAAASVPLLGGFIFAVWKKRGWESYEERHLLSAAGDVDSVSSATVKTFQFSSLKDLKGQIPKGKIGDLELSKVIVGGNLMGGWAHARDLIYVSKLVKSYHDDRKVFETLRLAESCGMNTILTNPVLCRVINAYWRREGGKIQFISDCAYGGNILEGIKVSIDGGAHACYVQGGVADKLVEQGKLDEIAQAVDFIRQNGIPAGVGAHAQATVQTCVDYGIKPDYWVKTIHHCNYWSARNEEPDHDNNWCREPDETIAFMNDREEPWIGFKVLAAGAIEPKEGFRYAFEAGADFICVGMYDFQIVDDANIALDVLASDLNRKRPWRA